MAQFKYTALSPAGQRVTGIIEGFNELDAAQRIKEKYSVILKLKETGDTSAGFLSGAFGGNRLNTKAFTVMCSQFAIILKAGIPIARTVHLIAEKTTDKGLRRLLDRVADDVEGGRSLSAAFEEHGGELLPPTFIETLRAGEETGDLDRSFQSMYDHFDKQTKMRAKVRSAMGYPLFVLALSVVVVIVIMVKVVPTFTSMFAEYGAELPLPTRILVSVSDFFRTKWALLLAIIAGLLLAARLYGRTEEGRMRFARLALKLPVLGNINELNAASQFANTMAAMLGAGIQMNKAVSITSRVIDNFMLSKETGKLVGKLEEGWTLSASMREQNVMPDILVDMVGVGEETGELEETLNTISLYYDTELDEATKKALAKIEPALLIFIALIAGFIVVAVYMAMFNLYGSMNLNA